MKKLRSNRGISLVEILISLAIISISILSISNLVGIGINTNKRAEIKQQGLILGQQILEEIELLSSEEKYKNNIALNQMILPSQMILVGESSNETSPNEFLYKGNTDVEGINYEVEVSLNKNASIVYENNESIDNLLSISPDLTLDFKTESDGDNGYKISIYEGTSEIISNIDPEKIYIKVLQESSNLNKVYISDNINEKGQEIASFSGNKLMMNFTKEYLRDKSLVINISNNLSDKLNLYIKKSYQCNEKISVRNNNGSLNVTNNLRDKEESDDIKTDDLYEIEVKIKNNDKVVFEGYANKNLKINSNP